MISSVDQIDNVKSSIINQIKKSSISSSIFTPKRKS